MSSRYLPLFLVGNYKQLLTIINIYIIECIFTAQVIKDKRCNMKEFVNCRINTPNKQGAEEFQSIRKLLLTVAAVSKLVQLAMQLALLLADSAWTASWEGWLSFTVRGKCLGEKLVSITSVTPHTGIFNITSKLLSPHVELIGLLTVLSYNSTLKVQVRAALTIKI